MKKNHIVWVLLSVAFPLVVQAQSTGLAFLRIGPNADATALGDAQVAFSQGAFAAYWNPAGLALASSNSAALAHQIWIADIRTFSLATRFQAGRNGGIGLFATATGSGDLEARDRPGEPDGFFSAQFASVGASYGRRLGPIRAGITAKFLTERIYTENATGYAFDAGVQIDLLARRALRFGVALQNLGKMSELNEVVTPLPRMLRVGAAVFPFRILMEDDGTPLLNAFFTGEVSHVFSRKQEDGGGTDALTQFHAGIAAEVLDLVVVRGGFITNDAVRSFTVGAGVGYETLAVDYAFLPFEDGFGGPGHVITLAYHW